MRLVWIRSLICGIDENAVSASIALHPWFMLGNKRTSTVVFGAARVHMRHRLLFPPSTPCERIGSFMRLLWDDRQRMSPAALTDRVLLAQARMLCIGAPRDDVLVAAVAEILGAIRLATPARAHATPAAVAQHQTWIRESGRR